MLGLILTNKNYSLDDLEKESEVCESLKRIMNSNLNRILFENDYYEFGRSKKYFNMNLRNNLQ